VTAAPALQAGGALIPGRHIYIHRPEDDRLLELLRRHEYANLLSSRQMGKSSLSNRVERLLKAEQSAVARADLGGELGSIPDQELGYQGLLDRLCRSLGKKMVVGDWWRDAPVGTPNQKLLRFFRDVISTPEHHTYIFFDEIDSTLKLPYADDLFVALRTLYNERASEPAYADLTFCLIGVVTPDELIKERRTTSYNVGVTVELRDFNPEDHDLSAFVAALHEDPAIAAAIFGRILHWTNGQPYLTQYFVGELAGKSGPADVDLWVEKKFTSLHELTDPHFEQITRFVNDRFSEGAAALNLYKRILGGKNELDRVSPTYAQLKLSGLVKRGRNGYLVVRNRLYARLYTRAWADSLSPRRRERRLVMTTASAIAVSAALLFVIVRMIVGASEKEYLHKLEMAASPREAAQYYSILAGIIPTPDTKRTIKASRRDAEKAYIAYRNRRALAFEKRAASAAQRGETDQAVMYAAYSAALTGNQNSGVLERLVKEQHYDHISATLKRSGSRLGGGFAVGGPPDSVAIDDGLWTLRNGRDIAFTQLKWRRINSVAFGPNHVLYAADDGGTIYWLHNDEVRQWNASATAVLDLKVSPQGTLALAFEHSPDVVLLRAPTGESNDVVPRCTIHSGAPVTQLATSPNDQIAVADEGGTVTIHDSSCKRVIWTRRLPGTIRAMAFAGEHRLAVAVESRLEIWHLDHDQVARIQHASTIRTLSHNAGWIVTTSDDGVRVFNDANGSERRLDMPPLPPSEALRDAAFTSDGRHLVIKRGKDARVWSDLPETADQQCVWGEWQRRLDLTISDDEVGTLRSAPGCTPEPNLITTTRLASAAGP
jgi:WD40 repeat protein